MAVYARVRHNSAKIPVQILLIPQLKFHLLGKQRRPLSHNKRRPELETVVVLHRVQLAVFHSRVQIHVLQFDKQHFQQTLLLGGGVGRRAYSALITRKLERVRNQQLPQVDYHQTGGLGTHGQQNNRRACL